MYRARTDILLKAGNAAEIRDREARTGPETGLFQPVWLELPVDQIGPNWPV